MRSRKFKNAAADEALDGSPILISRRTVVQTAARTGIVASAAIGLAPIATNAAQTPVADSSGIEDPLGIAAQVSAVDSQAILEELLKNKFTTQFYQLTTSFAPHQITRKLGVKGAVGAVLMLIEGGDPNSQEDVMGTYAVFDNAQNAKALMDETVTEAPKNEYKVIPIMLAGLQGSLLVGGGGDNDYARSYLQVGPVAIEADDIFLADGARVHADASVFRSSIYLTFLLDYLTTVTRPDQATPIA